MTIQNATHLRTDSAGEWAFIDWQNFVKHTHDVPVPHVQVNLDELQLFELFSIDKMFSPAPDKKIITTHTDGETQVEVSYPALNTSVVFHIAVESGLKQAILKAGCDKIAHRLNPDFPVSSIQSLSQCIALSYIGSTHQHCREEGVMIGVAANVFPGSIYIVSSEVTVSAPQKREGYAHGVVTVQLAPGDWIIHERQVIGGHRVEYVPTIASTIKKNLLEQVAKSLSVTDMSTLRLVGLNGTDVHLQLKIDTSWEDTYLQWDSLFCEWYVTCVTTGQSEYVADFDKTPEDLIGLL